MPDKCPGSSTETLYAQGQCRQTASGGGHQEIPERAAGSRTRCPQTTASSPQRSSTRLGWRCYITDTDVFRHFTHWGVPMACNADPHQARGIKVYVCFYMAFLVHMDNMLDDDIEAVRMLNHRSIWAEAEQ
ncbi:hypothetical protein DL770_010131 [Monosporascus sp. CRB-9-2]|nr:hypothetical protein DL770_010131 [Monosporascus sp. CRB-9-2]